MSLLDNVVSYFKFDAASGNETDSHGAVTLTAVNAPGSASGKINNARSFSSASSQRFTGGDVLDFQKDAPRSISLWVNPTSLSGERELVSKRDTSGNDGWAVYASGPTGTPTFQLRGQGGRDLIVVANSAISTSVLSHLLFTFDGDYTDSSSTKIYVNGSSVAVTENEAALISGDTNLNSGAFTVGARSHATPTNFFDGLIDELGIWDVALSASDALDLYAGNNGLAYPFFSPVDLAVRRVAAPRIHSYFRKCEGYFEVDG